MVILAQEVSLTPESIVTIAGMMFAFLGALIGLLTLSYKVLGTTFNKFMARLEAQEKQAAKEKLDIRDAFHIQMNSMRDSHTQILKEREEAYSEEREKFHLLFKETATNYSEGLTENTEMLARIAPALVGVTDRLSAHDEAMSALGRDILTSTTSGLDALATIYDVLESVAEKVEFIKSAIQRIEQPERMALLEHVHRLQVQLNLVESKATIEQESSDHATPASETQEAAEK